jgi:lysozyme
MAEPEGERVRLVVSAAKSPRRLLQAASIVVLIVIVAAAAGFFYYTMYSPDRARYPLRGIDVSHHQGEIDWAKVAADDVAFAYIKASEGGDHVDEDFRANFAAARAAGITAGAYHFFTLCRPGADQAANFLAQLPRGEPMLPPAVDLEFVGNCSARPDPSSLAAEVQSFLDVIESALGRQAVVYSTDGFLDIYGDQLPKRPLWTRSISWHPGDGDWVIWQYHDRGEVDGIAGGVDLNVFQGGPEALTTLTK